MSVRPLRDTFVVCPLPSIGDAPAQLPLGGQQKTQLPLFGLMC